MNPVIVKRTSVEASWMVNSLVIRGYSMRDIRVTSLIGKGVVSGDSLANTGSSFREVDSTKHHRHEQEFRGNSMLYPTGE